MDKSPDAFRTISEVAEYLDTPAHVLRFWESRFPQIRPVKRAGGRRYYRPADVALLTGIKRLLHDEGLTIRGVQKILREQGVRHVAGLSGEPLPDDLEMDADAALEAALAANFGGFDQEPVAPERAESATIVALETALRRADLDLVAQTLVAKAEPSDAVAEQPAIMLGSDPGKAQAGLFDAAAFDVPPKPPKAAPAPEFDAPKPDTADSHTAESHTVESRGVGSLGADALPALPGVVLAQGDLAAALRALPAQAFARHQPEAMQVRARLVALRHTLLAPPVFDRH